MEPPRQPHEFIMMPFDEEFDDIYKLVIAPPLERAGYAVARADSALDQRNIMRNVISGKDMNEHADELRNEVPGFKDVWTGAMEAAAGLLTTSDYSEAEDIEKLAGER